MRQIAPQHISDACAHVRPGQVPTLNEQMLLTGVPKDTLGSIIENGLLEHWAGTNKGTAFGKGIYLAECPEKARPSQKKRRHLASRALNTTDQSRVTPSPR